MVKIQDGLLMFDEVFSILYEKNTDYLDELLKAEKTAAGYDRSNIEYLIARIYLNEGNKEKADYYRSLAQHSS